MLEGLAVWALFIYLLRLVGMPWNKYSKLFAYLGGGTWLLFVWVGLITYTPMDLSGGSLVQSPHIQVRPASTKIKGTVDSIHIKPNQEIRSGQLMFTIDDDIYVIERNKAQADLDASEVALAVAREEVKIDQANLAEKTADIAITEQEILAARENLKLKQSTYQRYLEQNQALTHSVTESRLDEQDTEVELAKVELERLKAELEKAKVSVNKARVLLSKAELAVDSKQVEVMSAIQLLKKAQWNLDNTKIYAPADGYVTNFIMREGQYVGVVPRMQMYTNEKYVLMRVNHQAIRNIKIGQSAEFATAVYPGQIFVAEVEGIVEASGESQGNLMGRDDQVRQTTGMNVKNKHHFVRLKISEPEGYDIPVGAVGLAWISGEKPIAFMNFLDVIRGIIIRMKSQIYYIYAM
ncbi:efflux RND transporter periplasmic adaptor subunit [Agarivorans aestuarii]|uniref:Efflux RND transporter periplasmic adaptor subunit n=1 Tax=Agarivorans aestuarii TaxID=1563703 RepID=A0ABU7G4L6_9ALTE|nr:efflux RND transporter periplasmic adaptor subunit [Agarivorans aestuarii]MEE1674250.1 efflux RND transporter periplasmic adaptor subunit [Agarivorans aestuarii]